MTLSGQTILAMLAVLAVLAALVLGAMLLLDLAEPPPQDTVLALPAAESLPVFGAEGVLVSTRNREGFRPSTAQLEARGLDPHDAFAGCVRRAA